MRRILVAPNFYISKAYIENSPFFHCMRGIGSQIHQDLVDTDGISHDISFAFYVALNLYTCRNG